VATSAGVVSLLVAAEPAFRAVRYAGAAYLVFLGLQSLLGGLRWREGSLASRGDDSERRATPSAGLRQGLISNLTNPKMIAFFPALLPQFVPAGQAAFPFLLALGLTFALMTLTWLSAYAFVVTKAGDLLGKRSLSRLLEGVTGIVLVGLGVRLLARARSAAGAERSPSPRQTFTNPEPSLALENERLRMDDRPEPEPRANGR
jgi:threonine/homoserine/homoserine lactone efflux protein